MTAPQIPCPTCRKAMMAEATKKGNWRFRCFGRDPEPHDYTMYSKVFSQGEPETPKPSTETLREKPVGKNFPGSSLLDRMEKISQRRVGK